MRLPTTPPRLMVGASAGTAGASGYAPAPAAGQQGYFLTGDGTWSLGLPLDVKASVRATTTANITLSGAQTIDGVAVIAGDRVLVKNQTTDANNGIYVAAAGAWARSTDANTSALVTSGMFTFVSEGTVGAGNGYVLTTADPITLGTTSLAFTQFSGAGEIVAGTNISKSGNTLSTTSTLTSINSIASAAANTLILGTGTFGTAVTFASATGIPTFATAVNMPTLLNLTSTSGTSAGGITYGADSSTYRVSTGRISAVDAASGSSAFIDFRWAGTVKGYAGMVGDANLSLNSVAGSVIIQSNNQNALTLDSSQNATFTGDLWTINGNAGAPSQSFTNDKTTGSFLGSAGVYKISTGGVLALTVDASQNATVAGNVTLTAGDVLPGTDNNHNIGSASKRWSSLYVGSGTASFATTISTYNGIATAGNGVASIQGAGRATAQTAANSSIATYTVGAADASFIVSANVLVTTATAHSFSIECAYTDEGSTARTVTFNVQQLGGTLVTAITNVTGAGPYEGVPLHIRAKASTSITIRTNAGGTYTTVTYNAEGVIQKIA